MQSLTLTGQELLSLLQRVFQPQPQERSLAILVDLPDKAVPDNPAWTDRRALALGWARALQAMSKESQLDVTLCLYRNVRHNNADLPAEVYTFSGTELAALTLPATFEALENKQQALSFEEVLRKHPLVLAPTQFSATAPLKLSGPKLGTRAATMPGFAPGMVPALRLDYVEINRRVGILKDLLDRAVQADFEFEIDGKLAHHLTLDLRFRTAHASGGLIPKPGTAGNLPSGEAYIVPYEGEREGEPSRSNGELPVQLEGDLVVYRIVENRAVAVVEPTNETARREAALLDREPAYGNLAELGLGVLGDFGVEPLGEILLDEKLGLHIAFGRSDHFGGRIGASDFTTAEAVIHIDRVYTRNLQPRIGVRSVVLRFEDSTAQPLMRDNVYVVDFH